LTLSTSVTFAVAAPVDAPRRLHVRASNQGFLPIQVEHYVMLLDWTGRELRAEKRGAIPDHLAPIVDRLGLNRSNWAETVRGYPPSSCPAPDVQHRCTNAHICPMPGSKV